MDVDAIIASIRKTGRGVVVHEAPKTCGLGAEIIALINEKALFSLQAPIREVTGLNIPFADEIRTLLPSQIRSGRFGCGKKVMSS